MPLKSCIASTAIWFPDRKRQIDFEPKCVHTRGANASFPYQANIKQGVKLGLHQYLLVEWKEVRSLSWKMRLPPKKAKTQLGTANTTAI